jgi:hypothetical protein
LTGRGAELGHGAHAAAVATSVANAIMPKSRRVVRVRMLLIVPQKRSSGRPPTCRRPGNLTYSALVGKPPASLVTTSTAGAAELRDDELCLGLG